MDLFTLFGSLALLLVLLLYVGRPLLREGPSRTTPLDGGAQRLFERKEQLLGAIVELELDREIGKVPEEDFERLFAQLQTEALATIAELDQLNGAGSSELERRIEAEIAALRQPATAIDPSCTRCGAQPGPSAVADRSQYQDRLRRELDRFDDDD